jgi:hypothetical protein
VKWVLLNYKLIINSKNLDEGIYYYHWLLKYLWLKTWSIVALAEGSFYNILKSKFLVVGDAFSRPFLSKFKGSSKIILSISSLS